MRNAVAIDDDVFDAANELARAEKRDIGAVISSLARKSLPKHARFEYRNGIPLLPIKEEGRIITMELVNKLRDDDF